ncbi:MAG: hypothetical protein JNL11_09650 [Bdellovibrionaceae bacterium]|nr:hypothetical protein [Pseudobdellovibrionaceae bacterium]
MRSQYFSKRLNITTSNNSLLTELGHGYINSAVTEFVLSLYDIADFLKKITGIYKYKTDGAMDLVFKFRRNILAHRGCNWGSEESNKTRKFLSQETIFKTCHDAAHEFMLDLREYISFEPLDNCPMIQKLEKHDLDNLFRNSPELKYRYAAPSMSEVINFFGTSLLPDLKK